MKYLTLENRKMIEKLLKEGTSRREVGRVIHKSHSIVCYELSHNKMAYEQYNAMKAHERFLKRQTNKGKTAILSSNSEVKEFVVKQLIEQQWSPQQIAGVLEIRHRERVISHETIYQFIYSDEGKMLELWLHLRRKKRPYRQAFSARKKRLTIPERTSIHLRPEVVTSKVEIGHLESDSMIFSKQRNIFSVQVERVTKKCLITRLENKGAEQTEMALNKAVEEYGEAHVKSITFDNGTENVRHTNLKKIYGLATYFCDAYASWQKGLVENINGLIRQYFPLHTDMSKVTDEQIYEVQEKLNNRPRKSLGYLTPNQMYSLSTQSGLLYA